MDDYIELSFDVFDTSGVRGRVKKTITVSDLINEVIKEFDDLDTKKPEAYALYPKGKNKVLDRNRKIMDLDIQMHDELEFKYSRSSSREAITGAERIFLVEENTRKLYEIQWHPAILGRPDADPAHNELLAVNLEPIPNSLLVSRKHAQITMEGKNFFIESLSEVNPTFLNDDPDPITQKRKINSGDRIILGKSQIVLEFLKKKTKDSKAAMPSASLLVEATPKIEIVGQTVAIPRFPFILGRKEADLNFEVDGKMSRRHVELSYDENEAVFYATDLGSVNGSSVDGVTLTANVPCQLNPRSVIAMGPDTRLIFQVK
jgi:pSer/pThr/pTyr-binding forkhead associated (FHA) protein